ncbi:hypothetical protein EDB85DRAFT_1890792 [Lactarius pseudohatsudake]|nr:hypothetical protein EDB85DRAFT_1890792 [Lactarius pseudohatsudake]
MTMTVIAFVAKRTRLTRSWALAQRIKSPSFPCHVLTLLLQYVQEARPVPHPSSLRSPHASPPPCHGVQDLRRGDATAHKTFRNANPPRAHPSMTPSAAGELHHDIATPCHGTQDLPRRQPTTHEPRRDATPDFLNCPACWSQLSEELFEELDMACGHANLPTLWVVPPGATRRQVRQDISLAQAELHDEGIAGFSLPGALSDDWNGDEDGDIRVRLQPFSLCLLKTSLSCVIPLLEPTFLGA